MQYNETPTLAGHTPAKKRRRWVLPTALAVGGLVVGIGAGGGLATAMQPEPETVMIEKPVEVEKVVTETVTEEVEVPVTPDACIDYIEFADSAIVAATTVIGIQGETLGLAGDVIGNPYLANDATAQQINDNTDLVNEQTAHIESIAPDMVAARADCESSAGDGA